MAKMKRTHRLFALLTCFVLLLGMVPMASAEDSVTVAFMGNATSPNLVLEPYSERVATYVADRLGKVKQVVNAPVVPLDQEGFLTSVREIAAKSPDIVFLEFIISEKRAGTNDEIKAKLEATIRTLSAGDKKPAIYFLYTPQATFMDYRAVYNEIAAHYGITVIDSYDYFREKYEKNQMDTKEYLTAGVIIGEDGHRIFSNFVIDKLRAVNDLTKPCETDGKAIYDISRYEQETVPVEEKVEVLEPTTEIYVSADKGADNAKGTKENPIRSIAEAKRRVRKMRLDQGAKFTGVTVYLREGLYQVPLNFTFDEMDGGTDTTKVVYKSYPGETARITNSYKLDSDDFKKVTDPSILERLRNDNARENLYEFDLTLAGIQATKGLRVDDRTYYSNDSTYAMANFFIVNGRTQTIAQYPNYGWQDVPDGQNGSNRILTYADNVGDRWETADQAFLTGQWWTGYTTEMSKITDIDTEKREITMAYGPAGAPNPTWFWAILNLLEEIDMPGEWFVDANTNMLYYYPRDGFFGGEIFFSTNKTHKGEMGILNVVEANNITFEGLEIFASAGSAVRITDSNNILVKDCDIHDVGFVGVDILCNDIPGTGNNGVSGCHIYRTASMGVKIYGGDRKNLTMQNDYVENCHFEDYSTYGRGRGIWIDGAVGIRVTNCTFHNDKSTAIKYGANENEFGYNEFYNLLRDSDDMGVMYGDHRGMLREGTYAHHNYFHHIVNNFGGTGGKNRNGMVACFYNDANNIGKAYADNNVFIDAQEPIFFSNNHQQAARSNLFINCLVDPLRSWATLYTDEAFDDYHKKIIELEQSGKFYDYINCGESASPINVLVYRTMLNEPLFVGETQNTYYLKYPWLEHYLYNEPLLPKQIVATGNVSFNSEGKMDLPNRTADTMIAYDNYMLNDFPEVENESYRDTVKRAMIEAEKTSESFTAWDIDEVGIDWAAREISDFELVGPANNQSEVDVLDLRLCWDYSSGADEYFVEVATDKDFKNVVFTDTTTRNHTRVQSLSYGAKRYYWRVTASSYNTEKFYGVKQNSNGVYTFTTQTNRVADIQWLKNAIEDAKSVIPMIVEGTEPGQYEVGAINIINSAIEEATPYLTMENLMQDVVDAQTEKVTNAKYEALSKMNITEWDFDKYFGDPSKTTAAYGDGLSGKVAKNGAESDMVAQTGEGVTFMRKGTFFSNEKVPAHEVAHFRIKFNYTGMDSPSIYSLFGLKAQQVTTPSWGTTSYLFLATKSNVELQEFNTQSLGKFYMTKPNEWFTEGEYHDVQFAAVPGNGGVRIILMVDGKIAYDHTDKVNVLLNGGFAMIDNSNNVCSVTLQPPEETDYPSLIELIKDPNSILNQK
ncbi:MAG: right-handed parallel beta-helix repeat-containing protein [Clostridia bacterium]|nr:right-handed parallel beta-helix repeat-containing protein [Clostridia bacterium]